MNFLQPWMLAALPLIALPIVIHLVNQRRFQTVPWAAMRFLLEASKMSSGTTKIRQWSILAMRTLAIAALILFTARPLTSGILAMISAQSNAVAIVIVDRSPSMGALDDAGNRSRLELAIAQLSDTLQTLGVQRIVQIDANTERPEEYTDLAQWSRAVPRDVWSATTDIPGLLESALRYAKNNPSGNTTLWLCSDMNESDWRSRDGRWAAIRDGFNNLSPTVRFSILDVSSASGDDRSIQVIEAKCVESTQGPELSLSFRVDRTSANEDADASSARVEVRELPIEISVDGARTSLELDGPGQTAQINDYRIPLARDGIDGATRQRGWGSVRLPSDRNPANDVSYFVYEQPPPRRTIIVSESPEVISAIELSASIAPQQSIQCETELISENQLAALGLEQVGLIVWHEQLPTGKSLEILERFLASGGQLLLVPPKDPDETSAFGMQWLGWEVVSDPDAGSVPQPIDSESDSRTIARIAQWQNDSQILANTLSGAPLPVGQLGIRRICRVQGKLSPLASLPSGLPILANLESSAASQTSVPNGTEAGTWIASPNITVCATTPSDRDSTLAGDGVVLYVAVQRLLGLGSQRAATVRTVTAGEDRTRFDGPVELRAGNPTAPSTEYSLHAGVYDTQGELIAIERGPQEDSSRMIDDQELGQSFGSLPWARVGLNNAQSQLIQEIWRWFVIAMLVAMFAEAILCLPRWTRSAQLRP